MAEGRTIAHKHKHTHTHKACQDACRCRWVGTRRSACGGRPWPFSWMPRAIGLSLMAPEAWLGRFFDLAHAPGALYLDLGVFPWLQLRSLSRSDLELRFLDLPTGSCLSTDRRPKQALLQQPALLLVVLLPQTNREEAQASFFASIAIKYRCFLSYPLPSPPPPDLVPLCLL